MTTMKTYIALLRGINVGGRNMLAMDDLVAILEGLSLENVRTYIQSGNVAFESEREDFSELPDRIAREINENHGFRPQVLLLSLTELERAIASNPFPEAEAEPKSLHLYFLEYEPRDPDLDTLETKRAESEDYVLAGKVFYLHAPEGIGRSKLAVGAERALGVPTTARNWRTVNKILEMARG